MSIAARSDVALTSAIRSVVTNRGPLGLDASSAICADMRAEVAWVLPSVAAAVARIALDEPAS